MAKYLKNYNFKVVCWDYGYKKVSMENVEVKYVPRKSNKIIRQLEYFKEIIKEILNNESDIYYLYYMKGIFFIKLLFPFKKFILDIRTGSVNRITFLRKILNKLLYFESLFFKHVTIISESLRQKLGISRHKSYIFPIGAEVLSDSNKKSGDINMIYIGTLTERKIKDTIIGLANFLDSNSQKESNIKYTLIGVGDYNELDDLKELVAELELDAVVNFAGYVHHKDIQQYFDNANIGVSYIPITEYYDIQPPTKTFEYLLSGLVVLATATTENQKIINNSNGILIQDNPSSFQKGIETLCRNITSYDPEVIRNSAKKYKWENIIKKFADYILNI